MGPTSWTAVIQLKLMRGKPLHTGTMQCCAHPLVHLILLRLSWSRYSYRSRFAEDKTDFQQTGSPLFQEKRAASGILLVPRESLIGAGDLCTIPYGFLSLFIHSFNKHPLSACYRPGFVCGFADGG